MRDIELTAGSEWCWHVRFDHLERIAGARIPLDLPYGLGIESDRKIVVQHSRLDSRRGGLAHMTTMGYAEH